MDKKYEFTGEEKVVDNHTLHRVRALRNFGVVKAGDLGGWIESEDNLSHDGYAWVYGESQVEDNAFVEGNAFVGDAAWVYGNARVEGNTFVGGDARVGGYALVTGNAFVVGDARVAGNARVGGNALVSDAAWVFGRSQVEGNAYVGGDARVGVNALVSGNACVTGEARVTGNACVEGNADFSIIGGFGSFFRTTTFFRCQDGKVRTQCGCFYGDLKEFRAKVKETHGKSKLAKEYLMIADLMEMHFAKER